MSAQDQRGHATPDQITRAKFQSIGPGAPGEEISVHFNPDSLEYTVSNNIKEEGNSTENKQQVSKSSGKLSMELLFDTTLGGTDVREQTEKLQQLMKPVEEGGKKIAPVVEFSWGTYRFRGIFSSYKETLNYFSSTGVPLRASISLSMTQQDGLFEATAKGDQVNVNDSQTFSPPSDTGSATGDPQTDRGLAEDNDEDNPRFLSGKELSVPSGPNLQPPTSFAAGLSVGGSFGASFGASVGAGLDIGFSAGVSAGVGIGLGIEAGIDVGLSAGFELDIGVEVGFEANLSVGASVSVGVSASVDVDVDIDAGVSGSAAIAASSSGVATASSSAAAVGVGRVTAGGGSIRPGSLPGFAGFGVGEPSRSAPAFGPTRAREPGVRSFGDEQLDGLAQGPSFGGNASAGVPAALGAFAGLRPVGPRRRRPVMVSKLRAQRPERELRTDTAATFEIGGRALDRSPNGLGADVGARTTLNERIAFDDPIGDG